MKEKLKNILSNSIFRKVILCIISIIIIVSLIFTSKKIYDTKIEIENSISEEYIEDEQIREGIIEERGRIKKEEYLKIILPEATIITLCIAISVLIIRCKNKK